jgi:hypothetical protein
VLGKFGVQIDTTFSKSGFAADAKLTGEKFSSIEKNVKTLSDSIEGAAETLDSINGEVI